MIKYSKILFIFCSMLLFSCNINGVYENRESDKKEGEEVTSSFYTYLNAKEYEKTYSLFTKKFFTITDTLKLTNLYRQIDSACGKVQSKGLLQWKTSIVKGSNPSAEYIFLYEVTREKCKSRETISLKKDDQNIRIASYDVHVY